MTKKIFKPKLFSFQRNHCGTTTSLNDHSPLDVFKLFFDQKLVEFIVDEQNIRSFNQKINMNVNKNINEHANTNKSLACSTLYFLTNPSRNPYHLEHHD